jgi:hypothetical protein
VAFGLIPLGAIRGRVVRDVNGNGQLDRDEPAMDGAVVVLDSGKRSERLKRGAFAFEAVPSGEHTVTLLSESLPDGAQIAGDGTQIARLERDRMTVDLAFLVSLSTRAEIRKVFAGGALPSSNPARATTTNATTRESPSPQRRFSLQVAAFDDPERARHMVAMLSSKGLDAYLVEPPISDPNAPYRVRIGRYNTRDDAQRAAVEMRKSAGKLWIAEGGK